MSDSGERVGRGMGHRRTRTRKDVRWDGPWRRRCGTSTSSGAPRASRTFSTSTSTSSTRSPRRRPSTACGSPAAGSAARPHAGHRGPQRADPRRRQADRRPGQPHPGRDAAQERRGVRRTPAPARRRRAGHRPRRRPAARPHPARHDDRLRRLAHLDARRLRRDRLRHRYVGGRARPGHADAAAGPAEDDGGHRQRLAARGRHRQGPDPHPDHPDRHRRRAGLHRGVPRPGHRGALDGGPDDGLQHVDRVGRQGRADRARPDDVRLHRGPARGAEGCRLGRRRRALAVAGHRRRRASSTRRSCSTPPRLTPFVTWGTNPGQGVPLGGSVPAPEDFEDEGDKVAAQKALEYMALTPGTPMRDIAVDTVFVGLVHQRPDRGPARSPPRSSRAATSPTAPGCSSCRARCGCASRPRPRASTRSSSRRAPSGAAPGARCAWA